MNGSLAGVRARLRCGRYVGTAPDGNEVRRCGGCCGSGCPSRGRDGAGFARPLAGLSLL